MGDQARRACHAQDCPLRQHHQYRQRRGTSRRPFRPMSTTATKGAVSAFTRSAAAELGEKGIRVNCISPGAIVTGIFGKNAGLEGSKADKVAGVVKEALATIQPIPARRPARRHRSGGGVSCRRRLRFRQRAGHRYRRRADQRHTRLVCNCGWTGRDGDAHQGGGSPLSCRLALKAREPSDWPDVRRRALPNCVCQIRTGSRERRRMRS